MINGTRSLIYRKREGSHDDKDGKTKELLAYLIDRGGMCSNAELHENLWEETDEITDHRSYLQNMISDI